MAEFLEKTVEEVEPRVEVPRSTFTGLSHGHKTTFREGDLVPIYIEPVVSGDTFQVDTALTLRMATPIFPVADNAYLDLFFFYVPYRLVWAHAKEFFGENTTAPWAQNTEYTVPQIKFGGSTYELDTDKYVSGAIPGTVMNYFGIPCSTFPDIEYWKDSNTKLPLVFSVSDLPNRAYRLIWNEFFRSSPLQYPVPVYTDDSDRFYSPHPEDPDLDYGGSPLKVNRFFDYFSGCLPAPQCGPSVNFGIVNDTFKVFATKDHEDVPKAMHGLHFSMRSSEASDWNKESQGHVADIYTSNNGYSRADLTFSNPTGQTLFATPDNLHAFLTNFSLGTVNQLREAFSVQRLYEALARTGNRYREILRGLFGVSVPDLTVQVPEYLGGDRIPINMDQVLQTSSTDSVSPQGNTAGYSLTSGNDFAHVVKSFTEPGMLIGLAAVRVSHTYSQSVRPWWYAKRKFDMFWPQFNNLGEQPVLKKCICPTGIPEIDNQVFGYQEQYADMRLHPNHLSGDFSPVVYADESGETSVIKEEQSSLAQGWTYSDWYKLDYAVYDDLKDVSFISDVSLSGEWLREESTNIGQTLAVPDEAQFIADFYFSVKATRPVPVHAIPGLIDHH